MPFCRESIVSTWDLDTFEDFVPLFPFYPPIVSTWDLDTFENYIAKRVFGWQIVST